MATSTLNGAPDPQFRERAIFRLAPLLLVQRLIAGAGAGLILIVCAINGTLWLDQEAAGATRAGALAFGLAWLAPFVVALVATLGPNSHVLRSLTFAAAVASVFLSVLGMFSIGGLIALITIGLFICVVLTRPDATNPTPVSAYLLTMVVMTCLIVAIAALYLNTKSACWSSEDPGWRIVSSINSSGTSSSQGSVTCTSAFTGNSQALVTFGALAIAAVATMIGRRFVRPESIED